MLRLWLLAAREPPPLALYPVMTFATAWRPSSDSFFSLAPWREDFVIDRHFVHDGVSNPVVVAYDAESLRLCLSSRPACLVQASNRNVSTAVTDRIAREPEGGVGEGFGKFISPVFSSKVPAPATSRPAGSCCAAALPRLLGDACSRSLCMFCSCFIL